MRKSLLLDADVIIDLHSLGLFERISKAYDICLTRNVFEEARYYKLESLKFFRAILPLTYTAPTFSAL